jgi:hypothetical protein
VAGCEAIDIHKKKVLQVLHVVAVPSRHGALEPLHPAKDRKVWASWEGWWAG